MATGAMVVFSNPTQGKEDEYNDWYDNVHLPEVCALGGVVGASRYQLATDDAEAPHRYLAIYELDQPGDVVMANLMEGMSQGKINMSEAIDLSSTQMVVWTKRSEHRP
jgi:hypothetical protein